MRWEVRQEFLHFSTSSFPLLLSHIFPFHLFFLNGERFITSHPSFSLKFFSSPLKNEYCMWFKGKITGENFLISPLPSYSSSLSLPFLSIYSLSIFFIVSFLFLSLEWILKIAFVVKNLMSFRHQMVLSSILVQKFFLSLFFCPTLSNTSTLHESWRTESVTYFSHPILRIFLSHTSHNSLSLFIV